MPNQNFRWKPRSSHGRCRPSGHRYKAASLDLRPPPRAATRTHKWRRQTIGRLPVDLRRRRRRMRRTGADHHSRRHRHRPLPDAPRHRRSRNDLHAGDAAFRRMRRQAGPALLIVNRAQSPLFSPPGPYAQPPKPHARRPIYPVRLAAAVAVRVFQRHGFCR